MGGKKLPRSFSFQRRKARIIIENPGKERRDSNGEKSLEKKKAKNNKKKKQKKTEKNYEDLA